MSRGNMPYKIVIYIAVPDNLWKAIASEKKHAVCGAELGKEDNISFWI